MGEENVVGVSVEIFTDVEMRWLLTNVCVVAC